ncbi:alpha-L-fucosidase [Sphingomonas sp. NIBR02145]|uniref:alpha-L-fucosidase n=1 Tax=Sphingomonas sp. NIBR02145 TaxID=3014784 RepID=UPI0022B38B15|nr:alpha-L-fucosidase [Sphingomonas sp. NIBR02145]WHU04581.1 alpha-L-fucosidase [Sphingomonas sp. NIBR02145]
MSTRIMEKTRMISGKRIFGASVAMAALALAVPAAAQVPGYEAKVDAKLKQVKAGIAKGPFKSDWDALRGKYRTPEWFRDAKFGIFIHWGPYSVPAFANEWYSRNMYVPGNAAYKHHVETYGPQSRFGYKDFIPQFKAEKFDPTAWMKLFQDAGARYVVPVAEHCDGFAMYASDFTEWDASKMGPKRDTTGEIAKAARAAGLHFGLSSHRAEHWWWYYMGRTFDSDVNDPKNDGLYGPAAPMGLPADRPESWPDGGQLQTWMPPNKAFLNDWMARTSELVDKYKPELIYFDWWTAAPSFEPLMRDTAAYYYNRSAGWGQQGIIAYKGGQFAEGSALFDMERGKTDALKLTPWQSDTSVSVHSWGYARNDSYRTAQSLISDLIDIVSKNGNLLLNVGPKADGTIPDEIAQVLQGMGGWLKVNGEAIYGTRPFQFFGEGPTKSGQVRVGGQVEESAVKGYTPADIRFTTKGDNLYALGLERPKDGAVLIKTLYAGTPYLTAPIKSIALLDGGKVEWEQTPKGLRITLPAVGDGAYPYALRIRTR